MKTIYLMSLAFLYIFIPLSAQAATTVTCYNTCNSTYTDVVGVYTLDLQCNDLSPTSYTGQLTVNGVSTPVNTKTCVPPVPPYGTVNVSSDIPSTWTITGPGYTTVTPTVTGFNAWGPIYSVVTSTNNYVITGSGNSQSSPAQYQGIWTISWGSVSGYTTPTSQTLTLAPGGSISFSGIYSAASIPTPATTAPTAATPATPTPAPAAPSSAPAPAPAAPAPAAPSSAPAPAPAAPAGPATCSLWGQTYQVGDRSAPAYQFIAVKSPNTCESISQTGICGADGQFAPPITYVNQSCKVMPTFNAF